MVYEFLLALTGQVVLRAATLGRLECQDLGSKDHRMRGASGALWYTHDGRRLVTPTGQMLAGLVFYVAIALVLAGRAMG